ncbi:MAG: biopolymer transporter ExbD [Oligoflexia bacterium]|nr:biopolymer transporter ExbD [Oligoflexia bacterium]
MAGKLIEDNQPIAEINIIPFVDIILVILIIFMVTVPFILKTGLSLDLPKASSSNTISSTTKINITVNTDGRIFLSGIVVDLEQIEDRLKNLKDINPEETQVLISADKNVLHGKVISVINAVKSTGLRKVAIATKKSK